ncbi:hydrolase TatD [Muribaculaceae bacterium Isolate-037 (Harlan)]|jgi:TatD DNase family protein|nr:hydrolase TatD [Muribaculaceae bacterium Isolate-037 (Harlan)]
MYTILDIHTHHPAPQPNAVVCVSPDDFNPIENQLYSVGIHPWKTADALSDDIWEKLEAAAEHPQVVAIGECGIDKIQGGPLFRQMQVMRRQIELSEKVGKPLIIHNVHAQDIIIGVKKDLNPTQPWLVHGFRGKPTIAKMLTDTGIWLSFNDKFNDMSVTETPIQFMLAETDESETPIADIITKLSSLKGEDLTATISENVARFLSLNS